MSTLTSTGVLIIKISNTRKTRFFINKQKQPRKTIYNIIYDIILYDIHYMLYRCVYRYVNWQHARLKQKGVCSGSGGGGGGSPSAISFLAFK